MILCHVFNSFTSLDARHTGAFALSQFIGGMAAPLFLFMTGMTLAFQMDSLDRRAPDRMSRWKGALRRGAYVLAIAYAFRLTNYLGGLPHAQWQEMLKVDILNCMGVGMLALAGLAAVPVTQRAQAAIAVACVIAGAAPVVSALDSSGLPAALREYIRPNGARFPFFPWVAYLAFGLGAGVAVKRVPPGGMDRFMQWMVLLAAPITFGAWYFSYLPYTLYDKVEFWIDSPMLILIKTGVCMMLLAGAYLWTEYGAGSGWSWMLVLGKTSLLAYWVHVMFVYGDISGPLHRALNIPWSAVALVLVTAAMVGLGEAKLRWSARKAEKARAAAAA